jgi:hypothetical protein
MTLTTAAHFSFDDASLIWRAFQWCGHARGPAEAMR